MCHTGGKSERSREDAYQPEEQGQGPEVVQHLFIDSGDRLPFCGVMLGRDENTGDWHAAHDLEAFFQCIEFRVTCCTA